MHIIAAKAVAFHEALQPAYSGYIDQVLDNAKALAARMAHHGYRIVSGGTDNHLFLVDVFSKGITGKDGEQALEKAGITVNKNTIPFDENPPMVASGLRIGTPAITTRGMGRGGDGPRRRPDRRALDARESDDELAAVKREVAELASGFPLYPRPARRRRVLNPTGPMDPVSAFFAPGGQLARGHPRLTNTGPGQEAMAETVARALGPAAAADGRGRHRHRQDAGLPRARAAAGPARRRLHRDAQSAGPDPRQGPAVSARIARDSTFSACVMKGRDNYLCRYRLAQFEREPLLEDLAEAAWVAADRRVEQQTTTGDRAEIADLPDKLRLWRDVNARADTCGGLALSGVRALLADPAETRGPAVRSWSWSIIICSSPTWRCVRPTARCCPDYDTVIFDEAHLLEEIATPVLRRPGVVRAGRGSGARRREAGGAPRRAGQGRGRCGRAARRGPRVLPSAARTAGARGGADPIRRRSIAAARTSRPSGPRCARRWTNWFAACRTEAEADEGAESLPRRVEELREALSRVLDRDDPTFVYGMELRGRANVVLTASPIDVSGLLRTKLFDQLHAAVLTSATLGVEGKFDFFRTRLGLDDADGTVVESSFDYQRQALLYLPRRMPEPRDPRFVDRAVEELTHCSRSATDARSCCSLPTPT